jgi:hypothetical protein
VRVIRMVKEFELIPYFIKYIVRSEQSEFINVQLVIGTIVKYARINFILPVPFVLNYSFHNSTVENSVKFIFVKVPETIISLVIYLFHQCCKLIRIIININAFANLVHNDI